LKFFQEVQLAMKISEKKFQLIIIFFYTQNNHNKDLEVKFDYQTKFNLLFNEHIKF